jgi:hypothetical protein
MNSMMPNYYDPANKMIISVIAGLMFMVVSAPALYRITDGLLNRIVPSFHIASPGGCPNMYGLLLHGLVYIGLTRLLML